MNVRHLLMVGALLSAWVGWGASLWAIFDMIVRLMRSGALTQDRILWRDTLGFIAWVFGIPLAVILIVIASW